MSQGGIDSYTKLMLHMDGTDASTTFTDDSSNGYSVTANGDSQIDTADSKFGGASGLFDGTVDYLSIADNADWSFGTGDFTVDFWFKLSTVSQQGFVKQSVDGNNYWAMYIWGGGGFQMDFTVAGVSKGSYYTGDLSLSSGVWYHAEFVRNGSSAYIFLNGVSQGLTTSTSFASNDVGNIASALNIGVDAGAHYFNGWMDEFRISKGIARHTANFTPASNPYDTGSSSSSSCRSSSSSSRSSSSSSSSCRSSSSSSRSSSSSSSSSNPSSSSCSFSSSSRSSSSSSSSSAVLPGHGGVDSYTKLMLHMEGSDGSTTFTDSSISAHTITANNDAQVDTAQSKFGVSSGLFDGTGDYLSSPDSDDWSFGSGDFTVDFWFKLNNTSTPQGFISQGADANNYWAIYIWAAGGIQVDFVSSGSSKGSYYTNSLGLMANTWYHLAVVRYGTNAYIFLNGVSQTRTVSAAFSFNDVGNINAPLNIGRDPGGHYLNGWMDEVRISKGLARWTSNFTPPEFEYDALSSSSSSCRSSSSSSRISSSSSSSCKSSSSSSSSCRSSSSSSSSKSSSSSSSSCRSSSSSSNSSSCSSSRSSSCSSCSRSSSSCSSSCSSSSKSSSCSSSSQANIITWIDRPNRRCPNSISSSSSSCRSSSSSSSSSRPSSSSSSLSSSCSSSSKSSSSSSYSRSSSSSSLSSSSRSSSSSSMSISSSSSSSISSHSASGNDSYTVLLLHGDGLNNSTTFIDSSASNHTVTPVAGAHIDTAQSVFGVSSISFDGHVDYLTLPDSTDWSFGTGDFTIDFWFKFRAFTPESGGTIPGEYCFMGQIGDGPDRNVNNWAAYIWPAGGLQIKFDYAGNHVGSVYTNDLFLQASVWYHVAFIRTNGNMYIYLNGVSQSVIIGSLIGNQDVGDLNAPLTIGVLNAHYINGWMEEIRISKGIARWTSNFTPPTQPYS